VSAILDRFVAHGCDRVDIYAHELFPWIHWIHWMLGGLLVLFAEVAEIKTICGFNHTVNNMVRADQTLHVAWFL